MDPAHNDVLKEFPSKNVMTVTNKNYNITVHVVDVR